MSNLAVESEDVAEEPPEKNGGEEKIDEEGTVDGSVESRIGGAANFKQEKKEDQGDGA